MKKFLSGFCAAALATSFAVASIAPVNAAPIFIPKAVAATTDIQLANHGGSRRMLRRDRFDDRHFRRDGNYAWYGEHRGYRTYRRGYRQHNGYWFPAAAFLAGALITGAIVNNNNYRVYSGGNSHVSWCYDRWRSYRAYDNSYQPYNGPRRICYSPYPY